MIQSFGDLMLVLSIGVALWYVPRYLWRVYGGPPIGAWIVSGFQFVMLCLRSPDRTDETDRLTDRRSASADDLYCPHLELDRSKAGLIDVLVYNGWSTGDIRSRLKGDNGAIGAEVDQARRRMGIEAPDSRTPIALRPTDAKFASHK